jgi:dienelactone hydrolase
MKFDWFSPRLILLLTVLGLQACASLGVATHTLAAPDETFFVQVFSHKRNQAESVPVDVFKPLRAHTNSPAVLYFSGCGGITHANTQALLQQLRLGGATVAIVQSMRTQGRPSNICADVALTGQARAEEAFLARQALVDRGLAKLDNVAVVGSSHGGWTITYLMYNEDQTGKYLKAVPFKAAVAFYPYCQLLDNRSDKALVPTLMLVGGKDDWTPPHRCIRLKQMTSNSEVIEIVNYPGATHAWDIDLPPRNIVASSPSGTAFMVFDPAVTNDAYNRSLNFLNQHLQLLPVPAKP